MYKNDDNNNNDKIVIRRPQRRDRSRAPVPQFLRFWFLSIYDALGQPRPSKISQLDLGPMWTVDLWSSLLGPWGHPLRHLFPLGKPLNLSYPQFSALLASLDFFFQIFTCFSLIFSSHIRSKPLKLNENTQVFLSDPPNPSNPRNLPPNPQSILASKWGRRNARSD